MLISARSPIADGAITCQRISDGISQDTIQSENATLVYTRTAQPEMAFLSLPLVARICETSTSSSIMSQRSVMKISDERSA